MAATERETARREKYAMQQQMAAAKAADATAAAHALSINMKHVNNKKLARPIAQTVAAVARNAASGLKRPR